jgi:hypothetical protein
MGKKNIVQEKMEKNFSTAETYGAQHGFVCCL